MAEYIKLGMIIVGIWGCICAVGNTVGYCIKTYYEEQRENAKFALESGMKIEEPE